MNLTCMLNIHVKSSSYQLICLFNILAVFLSLLRLDMHVKLLTVLLKRMLGLKPTL